MEGRADLQLYIVLTKQYNVTRCKSLLAFLQYASEINAEICFCYTNFVSSFTSASFLCTPIFSFPFLLGCCVILTCEVPSALTGEAAGELGCIECQAACMFKAEGEEEKTVKKNLLSLWRIFGSSSDFLQGRRLKENEGFAFKKLLLSLLMVPLYFSEATSFCTLFPGEQWRVINVSVGRRLWPCHPGLQTGFTSMCTATSSLALFCPQSKAVTMIL